MEQMYPPRIRSEFNIKEIIEKFGQELPFHEGNPLPIDDSDLSRTINFGSNETEFANLTESISLDNHLFAVDDMQLFDYNPARIQCTNRSAVEIPSKALTLHTIKAMINYQKTSSYRKDRPRFIQHKDVATKNADVKPDLIPLKEISLIIRVYHPFWYRKGCHSSSYPRFSQQYMVLGSQFLSELRDVILCPSNFGPFFDLSDDPSAPQPERLTNPGFFFIGNTFYNDTRNPDNPDYSEVIRNWAAEKMISPLDIAKMELTKFEDLTVRLGYPYLYKHHGNCEHLFAITDIRLLSADDSLVRSDYPVLQKLANMRDVMCIVCGKLCAHFVVCESKYHILDPAHLCHSCFHSFHYIDGKKIGHFKAYRFYNDLRTVKNTDDLKFIPENDEDFFD